jgi:hypothetical protein
MDTIYRAVAEEVDPIGTSAGPYGVPAGHEDHTVDTSPSPDNVRTGPVGKEIVTGSAAIS